MKTGVGKGILSASSHVFVGWRQHDEFVGKYIKQCKSNAGPLKAGIDEQSPSVQVTLSLVFR